MGNMWDAADLVQETLVRGFSHLGQKGTVQFVWIRDEYDVDARRGRPGPFARPSSIRDLVGQLPRHCFRLL
mgnify:FL=1